MNSRIRTPFYIFFLNPVYVTAERAERKSKFPLKMISKAFHAKGNPRIERISSVDALTFGEGNSIQRSLNVYFCAINIKAVSCFFNPPHVILSFINELARFY